ncbi:ubiquitin carboxyl-terminal hydrolase 32 [Schistocerca americana]|uniref:ubiquitin carboxyl-terminal hydrolase 32 n=1 Tax=Schistocerca americana TaxID=7009 RepID=UPI001F4FE373|nr:ubiquitin carboxyl-terminal hydrolase 32 [Schistocerca americana]
MGAKDSKPLCITYEEAAKRVTEAELKRLKEAFKRVSTVNGCITKQSFVKDVLGDGVPTQIAEYIFSACGGTQKGIVFKDLLCGLVLLTRGKDDEKLKFLFGLYSNESGSHISRDDFLRLLQATESSFIPEAVTGLFSEKDRVSYEEFRDWLLSRRDATSLSRWLLSEPCTVTLSNELETPTFYQTLAGVTHLEESDIIELEKRYWLLKGQSRTGKLDLDTLVPLVSPPVPLSVCAGVFAAFDENRDSHIDFKEMACGVSAACRGPLTERQKFCFKVFDGDRDGVLTEEELQHMIDVLLFVRRENKSSKELSLDPYGEVDVEMVMKDIRRHATSEKGLTTEEYLMWTVENPLPMDFLNLLFQVCHIVLGLRPVSREEEGEIVKGWLEREKRRGYRVGQFWYLIASDWWRSWENYVSYKPSGESPNSSNSGSLRRGVSTGRLSGRRSNQQLIEDAVDATTEATDSLNSTRLSTTSLAAQETSRSSSVASSPSQSPRQPRKATSSFGGSPSPPGPIDNTNLVSTPAYKVATPLTGEGGKLKRSPELVHPRDFELVPDSLWKALSQWYGGSPPLPRQVILPKNGEKEELELFPLNLRLLRHQSPPARAPQASWSGMVGGYGAAALSSTGYAYVSNFPTPPKRQLAYVAAFSRMATIKQVYDFLCARLRIRPEDMRLWHYRDENNMLLIEDEEPTLEDLGIMDEDQLLIEVRNKDLTWPEEMGSLANHLQDKRKPSVPAERGATGLNNLGNTCFMNAALQCVSNTRALTQYFTSNMHLYELNRANPLGMKGHIAKRYGDLIHDIWSGTAKTIAPLKLRWTIGKYAPRFNGFQQHDSQELLAFLLDGLHEDLNRVHDRPYVELKDSDGRPDVIVAQEAWENHILRNKSIIVDLFHGQLKSKVTCKVCGHESVRFDPFNYLSLPLPMESYIHVQVIVMRLDGSVPVKYGLRLNMDEKYSSIKAALSPLCGIPAHLLRLAEVTAAQIKTVPPDDQKIKTLVGGCLYAYELPEIGSLFGEEERLSICSQRSNRDGQTFVAIQRSVQPRPPPLGSGGVTSSPVLRASVECDPHSLTCNNRPVVDDGSSSNPNPNAEQLQAGSSSHRLSGSSGSNGSLPPEEIAAIAARQSSGHSSASSGSLAGLSDTDVCSPQGFIVALHRKMIRQDVYFLSSQKTKPSLFGLPIIVPCSETTTHQDLYHAVLVQVARLVSPLPPSETAAPNHAQDCDDSLGYEFPFVLKAVQRDGMQCALCPWYRFCRGCRIPCSEAEFNFRCTHLAIDWDPTALHLRYQTSQERVFVEHESVPLTRQQQSEPIDLDFCLEAFTKEEHLGEDEKYYCSKCGQHQLASKKLQIWRLPPILIVHLKRFQFVNGKWVKSQKVVNFPFRNFDPTAYLASVPKQTVIRHKELKGEYAEKEQNSEKDDSNIESNIMSLTDESEVQNHGDILSHLIQNHREIVDNNLNISKPRLEAELNTHNSARGNGHIPNGDLTLPLNSRERLVSTSLVKTPVVDCALQDFHQHRLTDGSDPFDLKYNLYAVVSHSGILGGGHYVSYACNPNGRWYCYNDSSCKEVSESQMDTSSAYMLFYEREGLDQQQYMPSVVGKAPDTRDLDDEFDSDLKKLCCLM